MGGYLEVMHDLHGSDFAEVPDDHEVWDRVQAGGRRIRVRLIYYILLYFHPVGS
ncbi:hypothetical protein Hdeb2414_s0115g00800421 [Helianthus debilis subsp. tardiflorus]